MSRLRLFEHDSLFLVQTYEICAQDIEKQRRPQQYLKDKAYVTDMRAKSRRGTTSSLFISQATDY